MGQNKRMFAMQLSQTKKQLLSLPKVYNSLLKMPVHESAMLIHIEFVTNQNEVYPLVYGTDTTLSKNTEELKHFDISSLPWNVWLGMSIDNKVLTKNNVHEIIAFCLYEMTFWGNTEEKIKKFWDDLGTVQGE